MFITRKVIDGKVKYNHKYWKPKVENELLNDKKFIFGTYKNLELLNLWGTPELYKAGDDSVKEWTEFCRLAAPDGYFRQDFWYPVI